MAQSRNGGDGPMFLRSDKLRRDMGITGGQASAIEREFVTRGQLLDALDEREDLTERDGIGKKTANAIWDWYKNIHGETLEADGTLVLDDEGLHLPDWIVGFTGTFSVRTPSITMRPTTTERGLGEVSDILGSWPGPGNYHEDLEEGMMAFSTPDHAETVYEIDDRRTETDEEAAA